ncbi:radical SAM/SPASM domain-containing protein [Butyrivibrio sp. AE2032]|uniref:radical SAM/SPASM domain-containing protein n=1 Tax=Butyrivibrio sp. AE2032 TaxID=1458463 RepID=UPI0005532EAB|nr:radical SAM protein [Butyrivibrio sp. AE2032]
MNLTLHLTENCNMDCTYCIREKCPKDMTEDVLFAACDLAFSKGQRAGLCFFGGEPLLKKDLIFKALDYCGEKSRKTGIIFDCKMTTNGSLLDEEFLERAVKANMGIGLSFDGKAQDICRIFAGGKPTSSVVEEKAKLLLRYMPEASALATIAPQAVPYYADSVKYLHELGFKHLSFVIAYGSKVNWTDDDLDALRLQLEETCRYIKELFINDDKIYVGPIFSKIGECIRDKNPAERCHLGVRQMPVTPDGSLYPCTSFIGDEYYLLGNVFEGINEEKVIEIAKRSSTPETCKDCALVKRCTNSCGCANRMNTGDENKVSPLQCTYERMLIEVSDALGEELYQLDPERFAKVFG